MKKPKLLFVHTPKTAGVYVGEYIPEYLGYRRILSDKQDAKGIWVDFTTDEIKKFINEKDVILQTHALSFGWHHLTPMIPMESKEKIVETIKSFREKGWFVFSFIRHPGEILCSFYHYVYDLHVKGEDDIVAADCNVSSYYSSPKLHESNWYYPNEPITVKNLIEMYIKYILPDPDN